MGEPDGRGIFIYVATITGYDAVARDEEGSRAIELARATNVAAFIVGRVDSAKLGTLSVRGAGGPYNLHTNDLPEGRAYNRTVSIVIARPVRGYPLHED